MKTAIVIIGLSMLQTFLFAQPTINSFTPAKGPVGTVVTISGTNFSTTPSSNVVYFGAVRSVVTASTPTSITTSVPIGTTYQPVSVTVNNLTASANAPFIITFEDGDTSFTANTFATKKDFINGAQPLNLAAGDFDGDGKADIAVINSTSKTVSLFLNNSTPGTVSFAAKTDISTGTYGATGLAVKDIDGDGKLDIIVTIETLEYVGIYRNLSTPGTLSFATRIDFLAGMAPRAVAVDDLDGDGKPDLAVANYDLNSNSISIFKNNSTAGVISFLPKVDYSTANKPWDLAISDFDGDKKPDIVTANYGSDSISIFKNNSTPGNIVFAPKVNFKTGANPYRLATGDLDGDNKIDIAVTNDGSNTVSVFTNLSTHGVISISPKTDYPVARASKISLGDLNGDGKPDIVVTGNIISVLKNISTAGTITFKPKVDYTYTASSSYAGGLLDCDTDGKLDIALTDFSFTATNLSVLKFIGNPVISLSLLNFSSAFLNNQTQLLWQTTYGQNTVYFDVQTGKDSLSFIKIGQQVHTSNGSTPKNYSFYYNTPLDYISYYRLKIVNKDSSFTYSPILSVLNQPAQPISLSPNPVSNIITIRSKDLFKSVKIVSTAGTVILNNPITSTYIYKLNIPNLQKGLYILNITVTNGESKTSKFIVN